MELGPSAMSNTINGSGGSGGSDGSNGSGPYELPPSPTTDHDSAGYAHFGGQILGECGCKRRIVISIVVGFLLVLAIAAGVIYHVTSSTEEVVCPYTEEYSRVHIWSPRKKFENGDGPVTFDLKHDTDTIVEGYNIQVKNNLIIIRKEPPECADEEDQPITFTKENNTKVDETRLSLKVKDYSDEINIEVTPYTNGTDKEDYVQVTCSGYHRCGTALIELELTKADFGNYYIPLNCTRTNSEGMLLSNYGYVCTYFMTVEIFQRTDKLRCKPTADSLKSTTPHSVQTQSVDVRNSTLSKFSLEKGKNETIKWNVHVKDPLDVHQLQTELNGIFRPNRSSLNGRFHFDVSVVENIATCEVRLTPTSCVDNGKWMLHFQNGDTLDKQFQVDGIPNLTACPEHLTVPLKDNENGKLELQFISCIPDAVETYSVDIYGRINKSGLPRTDAVIDIPDQKGINFQASTDLNELLVTLTMGKLTCDDHEKKFNMILVSKTGAALQHFTSIASIVGRYGNSSTGGDFIENKEAVVNLRIHLGCRPQNYKIFINGSHEISPAKLIEDVYTGEKMFSQTFSYPQTSMADDRTTLSLESSFIDDEGKRNTVSAKQEIRIVPETFCEEKNQGCNYQHPYNANKMIACGDKVIAAFRSCQDGLVFVKSSSCVGLCCPEGFTDNCQRP